MKIQSARDLESARREGLIKIQPGRPRIGVGTSSCGIAVGGMALYERMKKIIQDEYPDISLVKTGCIGFCKEEPIVSVSIPGKSLVLLHKVQPDDAERIISLAMEGRVPQELALCKIQDWDHITGSLVHGGGFDGIKDYDEIPFFANQKKIILRNCGLINPEDIMEYIGTGGYFPAFKAITSMEPEAVIEEVKRSGLRGRGGAGFPAGIKWEITKKASGEEKYIVCNADEGDPGAYMNRNEMESDPHMLLEGMLIGAYAMGVHEGLIYIRAEYPLAIERLMTALDQARSLGLLGKNILNSGFDFDIQIATGAGVFVCGESTALAASIEGKTGRPRIRPPRLTEKGIFGRPTDLNNVETWCNVPVIIAKGASWFSSVGAKGNTGTKVFSLVGKVDNVGMVEVPLGTSLNTIIFDIGNGGAQGRRVKAVQTGGPSGGCIPVRLFDTPVDYESLNKVGTMMGSGGLVVMDEDTNMADIARYFISFASGESCGKCVPCREGLKHMLLILNRLIAGKGTVKDLNLLKELSETVQKTSLCGLGQTAPNPVLTTMQYFKEEYDELLEA